MRGWAAAVKLLRAGHKLLLLASVDEEITVLAEIDEQGHPGVDEPSEKPMIPHLNGSYQKSEATR